MKIKGNENILLITIDSCRWDTFKYADLPVLKSFISFYKAYAQGTYTLPSHISLYSGILPNVRENLPYFNRFNKDLFRINYRKSHSKVKFSFSKDYDNIIAGFKGKGYHTFGVGAMSWFKHPLLYSPFDEFFFSGIDIDSQIDFILQSIKPINSPFFCFMNIGETHEPYEFGGKIEEILVSRARMRKFENIGFIKTEHLKQIKALEYIDEKLGAFFKIIESTSKSTLVVICGDHGECFGEDGLYGHGFYHPKVIEVPLGIFKI